MSLTLPDDQTLYDALCRRDPQFDGLAFVGVTSTGIFCRLVCPARKPKQQNTRFFGSVAECLAEGFRPCLRCHPLATAGTQDPVVARLVAAVEADPERKWDEGAIVAEGIDPSTARRAFRRAYGMTFLAFARQRRVARAASELSRGGRVIDAQLEAGFDSGSGFRAAFTRLLGHAPAVAKGRKILLADWIETPVGPMIAIADEDALHLLEFHDRKSLPEGLKRLSDLSGMPIGLGRPAPIERVAVELDGYFAGRVTEFRTDLVQHGTAFTTDVWQALRAIPFGQTRSYRDVAQAVGNAGAVRAVARANATNRMAVVIPCHRVIGADGALAGYAGGVWRKRWLLDHERRVAEATPQPR